MPPPVLTAATAGESTTSSPRPSSSAPAAAHSSSSHHLASLNSKTNIVTIKCMQLNGIMFIKQSTNNYPKEIMIRQKTGKSPENVVAIADDLFDSIHRLPLNERAPALQNLLTPRATVN